MPDIHLEQALYHRATEQPPRLLASSPGYLEAWQHDIQEILIAFGDRPVGTVCPPRFLRSPWADIT